MDALNTAWTIIYTIVAPQRIAGALASRPSPATQYLVSPGDRRTVYLDGSRAWEGPLIVIWISGNHAWLQNSSNKEQKCIVVQLLPEPTGADDRMRRQEYMSSPLVPPVPHTVMQTETVYPCDPRSHFPVFHRAKETNSPSVLHGTRSRLYHGTQCRQIRTFCQKGLLPTSRTRTSTTRYTRRATSYRACG